MFLYITFVVDVLEIVVYIFNFHNLSFTNVILCRQNLRRE